MGPCSQQVTEILAPSLPESRVHLPTTLVLLTQPKALLLSSKSSHWVLPYVGPDRVNVMSGCILDQLWFFSLDLWMLLAVLLTFEPVLK